MSHPPAEQDADISCHSAIIGLALQPYLVYRRDIVQEDGEIVTQRHSRILCFVAAISIAANASGQVDRQLAHQSLATYSIDSFSGTISPHFLGNDLRRIYDTLSTRIPTTKDEFETTAEYQARVRSAVDKPITGDIKSGSELAFVIPSPLHNHLDEIDNAFITATYTADNSTMTVWLFPSLTYQLGEPNSIASLLDRPSELHSVALVWGANAPSYRAWEASNAFGASVTVKEQQFDAYGLAFDLEQPSERNKLVDLINTGTSVSFVVPVNEARIIKNRLRILIICQMKDSPLMVGMDYHKATMTSPNETVARYKYLHVRPISLWIFDEETGKVYLKRDGAFFDDTSVKKLE